MGRTIDAIVGVGDAGRLAAEPAQVGAALARHVAAEKTGRSLVIIVELISQDGAKIRGTFSEQFLTCIQR